jgi:hypothetical protein
MKSNLPDVVRAFNTKKDAEEFSRSIKARYRTVKNTTTRIKLRNGRAELAYWVRGYK